MLKKTYDRKTLMIKNPRSGRAPTSGQIIGLDIGGANTKVASADGTMTQSTYLPLWKGSPLVEHLKGIFNRTKPGAVAVVMTGELADCYKDKRTGVLEIKSKVEVAFGSPACSNLYFWGVRGFEWDDPLDLAAANWSASASLVAREVGNCIFVDMGSTTTDLIPIAGKPLAADTDLNRLKRGELVYSGLLRTNLAALLQSVDLDGELVPLSSELFAVTADVYLALDEITAEEYSCETPDGAEKTEDAAYRRLARIVCADLTEIGKEGAIAIARQAKERQLHKLSRSIARIAEDHSLERVVAAGAGERLIVQACGRIGIDCTRLSRIFTAEISGVFPAYAAARLLEDHLL